jgi:hypothetical protein
MGEVQIAKKDVVAAVDEGLGVKIKRKVAIEGQPIDPAFADHVNKSDVTTEVEKTRSTSDRRAAGEEPAEAPEHDDVRAQAAAPAEVKRRRRSSNKSRSTAKNKSDDDE